MWKAILDGLLEVEKVLQGELTQLLRMEQGIPCEQLHLQHRLQHRLQQNKIKQLYRLYKGSTCVFE